MKTRKWSGNLMVLLSLCLVIGIALAACSAPAKAPAPATDKPSAAAVPAQVYKARLTYHWPASQQPAVMAERFAQLCKSETNGRLEVTTYPSGSLYGVADALGAVSQGSVEIAGILDAVLTSVSPSFGVGMQPFLLSSYDQLYQIWDSDAGKAVLKATSDKLGITIASHDPVGPTFIWTTEKKVSSIEDFSKLKARVLTATEKPYIEALGMNSAGVQTSEVYSALQQGMLNYVTTTSAAVKANSWWEFLKCNSQPAISINDAYIVINTKWLKSLPADIQDIVINKVAPKVNEEALAAILKSSESDLNEFKARGGTVTVITNEELMRLKKLMAEKVYPTVSTRFDPALWEVTQKTAGLK